MLCSLSLVLCGLLAGTRADPGVLLRLGMDIMNHEVQSAMEESNILEKMAAEASNPQPGGKAIKGLSNMKVKDILEPVITLSFVPGVGISQCVSTGMTITGKSFTGGNMEINVVLNITATDQLLQDEETGTPVFRSEGCEVILVSVKTNLPNNKAINKFVDSTLRKVLPGLMCPAIDAVLEYVNKKWANLTDPMAVDKMGTVKYALTSPPATTASHIQVDFNPVVQLRKGQLIQLDTNGSAPAFPEGPAKDSQLLLSATFLTAELALLQKSLEVKLKDRRVGKLPQNTGTLAGFIPQMAKTYHKPKPLLIKVKINKPPKVTMKAGKSLMHLHSSLEMFVARRHGKHPKSLFRLETHIGLEIHYSVQENRLQMVTSLDRLLSLTRNSSSVGDFHETELTGFITDYLQKAYIPVVNDVLHVGLPLPDLLAINYNLAELDIVEDALVLGLKME
ncbi:BPI fold-containing family B member 6 [Mus pahari]|uniref:BPI fold-containing family B member 6 n=1 Tax=Mus pahari TaxID=10093 RepID=UPI000A304D65|nr:BPI fold-containing family B member 6 [Mus pahari]